MKIVDRLDLTPSGKFEGVQASPPKKTILVVTGILGGGWTQ